MIEMKRCMVRFVQFQPRVDILDSQIYPKHNEFDSCIDPILHWLRDKGVHFVNKVTVTELKMNDNFFAVNEIEGKGSV